MSLGLSEEKNNWSNLGKEIWRRDSAIGHKTWFFIFFIFKVIFSLLFLGHLKDQEPFFLVFLIFSIDFYVCPSDNITVTIKWVKSLSHVRLFETPWTVAYKAPLSMEFSRQEYWNGLPFPSLEDLPDPDPGISPLISFQFVEEVKIQIPWSLHIFVWMISIM